MHMAEAWVTVRTAWTRLWTWPGWHKTLIPQISSRISGLLYTPYLLQLLRTALPAAGRFASSLPHTAHFRVAQLLSCAVSGRAICRGLAVLASPLDSDRQFGAGYVPRGPVVLSTRFGIIWIAEAIDLCTNKPCLACS
jgi:hypothetical protein